MKKTDLFFIAISFFLCSCGTTPKNVSGDFYKSVAEIRAGSTEGKDFRIRNEQRQSPVAVFAIHGGNIEGCTSQLAEAVAGDDYSYYMFEAFGKNARKYHITAAKFDDPPALRIAADSRLGIAMHVQKGDEDIICVGGGNKDAAKMMADMLVFAGYPVEYPCARFPGESPKNIVNRTKLGGVQFEFTFPLIQKIVKNKKN